MAAIPTGLPVPVPLIAATAASASSNRRNATTIVPRRTTTPAIRAAAIRNRARTIRQNHVTLRRVLTPNHAVATRHQAAAATRADTRLRVAEATPRRAVAATQAVDTLLRMAADLQLLAVAAIPRRAIAPAAVVLLMAVAGAVRAMEAAEEVHRTRATNHKYSRVTTRTCGIRPTSTS